MAIDQKDEVMVINRQSNLTASPKLPDHGGDLDWARRTFGDPLDGWLDLSTGINPWSYPLSAPDTRTWRHLPTADLEAELLAVARGFYGFSEGASLVAAPGTQAIIQWLPRSVPPSSVAILAPTYGEHARSWFAAGHEVVECKDLAQVPSIADIIIVVNPNNPDGRLLSKDELKHLAGWQAERGGFVLVDEAFGDLEPATSVASLAGMPGLVVLKSFGKFFGLAGLRLGFAAGTASMQKALCENLGPWALSNPALEAGIQALKDQDWAQKNRMNLVAAREALDHVLNQSGFSVVGGTDLFRLIAHPQAEALFFHLGSRGILSRVFSYNPTWLRLGLPGKPSDLERLAEALMAFDAS